MDTNCIRKIEEIPTLESCGEGSLKWVIDGMFLEGAVHLVTGDSGTGKSTFLSAAAHAVASDDEFIGRNCSGRKVLLVDAENPQAIVRERFARLGIASGPSLRVWGPWIQPAPAGPRSALIIDWVVATEPKPMIIFDSLVAFHDGVENDSADTRRFMQRFRNLASLGATVVVLHHTGKAESAQQFRGSSDFKAAVDIAVLLKRRGSGEMLSGLELIPFKQRVVVSIPTQIRFDSGKFIVDGNHEAVSPTRRQMRKLLMENPLKNARELDELSKKAGIPRKSARELLTEWVANDTVHVTDGSHGQKLHFWVGELTAERGGEFRCAK